MAETTTTAKKLAEERSAYCRAQAQACTIRFEEVDWNWLTKSMPAFITLLVAMSFFADNPKYKEAIKWLTLVASFFSAVHQAAGCDEYQEKLLSTRTKFNTLAVKYRTLHDNYNPQKEQELKELESDLAHAMESDYFFNEKIMEKARKRVGNDKYFLAVKKDDKPPDESEGSDSNPMGKQ